jgi:uncharacterized protein (UPF0335 family)
MQAHDLDAPNLNTLHEPGGRPHLFLEDDPPIGVEDDPPRSVEYDAPISVMPLDSKRAPSASVLFVFLFLVLAGVGGAFAWRYYHFYNEIERLEKDNARITADGGEVQQQLESIASDLAAVRNTLEQQRNTLEQQSAANHDQLTRIQEQISRQSIALLSSSFLADKPVRTPPPKPAQHPPHVSTQDSSKPIQVARPLPPKQ